MTTRVEWKVNLKGDRIEVIQKFGPITPFEGYYEIIQEPYCRKCSSPDKTEFIGTTHETCNSCANLTGFDKIYAVGAYYPTDTKSFKNSALSRHITKLKEDRALSEPLGKAMALTIRDRCPDFRKFDYLVPVPQCKETLENIGYDHAKELANVVGKEIDIPVICPLEKKECISLKTVKGRTERINTALLIYTIKPDHTNLEGKTILLIDDVSTSGATANACSIKLKENGASKVSMLVAGRTYRPFLEGFGVRN